MEGRASGSYPLSLRWMWLAWLALGFTVLGFVAFGMIARGDPTPLLERTFGDTGRFAFLIYTLGQVVAALTLILLVKKRGLSIRDLGYRGRLTKQALAFAAAGWFVAFWLYYIIEKLLALTGVGMFWNESHFLSLNSPSRVVIVVFATLVVAPLAEETIYRGYVLQALIDRMRTPVAVLLSALVFASIHLGIGLGLAIYIFFGAIILAYLFVRFQNIYSCVIMHLMNNVVAYLVIPLVVLE
jgi:membrane protease YdiL (CAAX protease family)